MFRRKRVVLLNVYGHFYKLLSTQSIYSGACRYKDNNAETRSRKSRKRQHELAKPDEIVFCKHAFLKLNKIRQKIK